MPSEEEQAARTWHESVMSPRLQNLASAATEERPLDREPEINSADISWASPQTCSLLHLLSPNLQPLRPTAACEESTLHQLCIHSGVLMHRPIANPASCGFPPHSLPRAFKKITADL